MEIYIKKNYEEMSRKAAEIVAEEMRKRKNHFVLGLATGSTPIGLYKELIRMHQEEGLDFSRVITFNLDEYCGLSPDHEQSYHYFMFENFFKHINIDKKNIHIPDGMARDLDAHCREYEKMIADNRGIDLQVLGIGGDGHIAFNEPGSSLSSRTRVKTLTQQTVEDNSRFFKTIEEVPKYAITMGIGTIMEAKICLLLVNGDKKAEVFAKAVEGPMTTEVTASMLQTHPRTIAVVDEEAAAKLKRKDYYKHVEKMAGLLKKRVNEKGKNG
ncbi:MAG: glucosamine-6-phosphate deaminase [bacterium (Candidatus Ratteibacteria) CG_4_9_14_3_um_filter_41_21]|uniref:Glucosamine-6-phosphate deaminase n=2 Tax=Candidatus Ratteibacteria TaxID=2979319 RepID=A0A2M7YH02_9BACT|nr:MAG: glucosamine-6-phosphate deaminase [bacterium (Candidatus Ratteibacteria) CG15_BIG_FIL_POST_REV_8_21_14_020_41_12]PJA62259.1 MAG: glucosamine-6-phosphate deaminase [bacterium (Candidatus Ratteibacteria) CG_4_9_14_3_um_filter_41_21]